MKVFNFALVLVVSLSIIMVGCDSNEISDEDTAVVKVVKKEVKVTKDSESKVMKKMGKNEKVTLKVMANKRRFLEQYGKLFGSKFPNIDVEVISMDAIYEKGKDPDKELAKIMEEEKPDVLMLDINQYEQMAADNKLLGLDAVIKKDKFDIENILPAITDTLRSKGNGTLYGLSQDIYSYVLYYNKDLFEQNGVELPRDQMSWSEVLDLAKRFPTIGDVDKRIYGLFQSEGTQSSVSQFANMIGRTEKLSMIDRDNYKVTLDTDDWKRTFQTTIDAINSKAMNSKSASIEDFSKSDYFVTGRAAMTISNVLMFDQIKSAKAQIKDYIPFNWDMVTVPVDPRNPDVTRMIGVSYLYAISAQATQQRAAWEFIKYINSDEYSKIISRSTDDLMTRSGYNKEKDGRSLEPFFKLKADTDFSKSDVKLPENFYTAFDKIVDEAMKPVLEGNKTLDEVLPILQLKGQELMDNAKAKAD